ncbi:BLUF domain-containing protein [uncultured Pelagimonas sp.]|uniref:BLUF domain-containing protein n=1 Tax=uncultured Pelagimonas sp. TaxID=1618102 RepID=UPI002639E510|nr:BLUF domain-containing protein [uncultured Pelagimonas sp.]
MFRAIYISHSKSHMSDQELDELLATSRIRNKARGVTGMLLYCGSTFFQVLEGPREQVQSVLEHVYHDTRHYRMKVLSHGPARKRRFKDWSMGYQRVHKSNANHHCFFDLSRKAIAYRIPKNAADDLLKLMSGYAQARVT